MKAVRFERQLNNAELTIVIFYLSLNADGTFIYSCSKSFSST